jgi:hypothetical protein
MDGRYYQEFNVMVVSNDFLVEVILSWLLLIFSVIYFS